MFVINRFVGAMFLRRLCSRFGEGLNPSHTNLFIKVIVKLYAILNDGRQAVVTELRRAYKLKDEVKESVTRFRGGFEDSVTI